MASANLAITACGTTGWELAYPGAPALVGSKGPVEDLLAAELGSLPFAEGFGHFAKLDQEYLVFRAQSKCEDWAWRPAARTQGQLADDGFGRRKILKTMVDLCL